MNQTFLLRTPLEAASFKADGLECIAFSDGLFRTTRPGAVLQSPVLTPESSFDDVVGSWNADLPVGARLDLEVQVLSGAAWSAWYSLGSAVGAADKRLVMRSPGPQEDSVGSVAKDTLKLKSPARALRYRLHLQVPKGRAILRLAAVTVSDPEIPLEPPRWHSGPWVRELKVRGRSQRSQPEEYKHDTCSPTSLSVVMDYLGVDRRTLDVAERVFDQATEDDFGNWTFNTAAAGALGLEAHVARLDSLDDLAAQIAQGRPVIASLTFGQGELSGAPMKSTRGHIVVVTGFTPKGDVIVMDPAGRTIRETRRVYGRNEFHHAWRVNKRGLSYLLKKPFEGHRFTIGVPTADLWAAPRSKAERLSQLLYAETVTVQKAQGDWVQVLADEQEHLVRGVWQGYPGWMKADALTAATAPSPNAVVRTRQVVLKKDAGELLTLSLGTRLTLLPGSKSKVKLLDGSAAESPEDALTPYQLDPGEDSRHLILRTAELFLGTAYHWGGRSGVQPDTSLGADCSGLSSLAFRVCGIDLPRDADAQYLRSRKISSRELQPGDLVFLTVTPRSKKIDHVLIYTGGDGLIESCPDQAQRSTFAERFNLTLEEITEGQIVTTTAPPKPRKRRIFFGSYF